MAGAMLAAAMMAGCGKDNEPTPPEPDDYALQIPDAAFKAYCLDQFDTDKDGKLFEAEVLAAKKIDLWAAEITTVASTKGIELFKNLTSLNCSDNQISELNLAALTKLTWLNCSNNQISKLNVSALTELTELYCVGNQISELNVSALYNLTELDCGVNPIAELDVSANGGLVRLACGNMGNPPLSVWVDSGTTLGDGDGELDIRATFETGTITNAIPARDTEVNGVTVKDKPLNDYLAVIPDAAFRAYCLDSFDTNGNGKLSYAEVLDVETINVQNRGIVSMKGVEYFENLTELNCSDNQISELILAALTALTRLECSGNQISELNLAALTKLTGLSCQVNRITELDVSALTELTELYCSTNRIEKLNLAALTKLTVLNCRNNLIEELDVSANGALWFLECGNKGNPPFTVWVDSGTTLGAGSGVLNIFPGTVLIRERDTEVNGVTVKNKP